MPHCPRNLLLDWIHIYVFQIDLKSVGQPVVPVVGRVQTLMSGVHLFLTEGVPPNLDENDHGDEVSSLTGFFGNFSI